MFTICPHCDSVHPLRAEQLAAAEGRVRCARCGQDFRALERLYDDYPDQRKSPGVDAKTNDATSAGDPPPELGRKPLPDYPAMPLDPPVREPRNRWLWPSALVALCLLTVGNLLWTFRDLVPANSALASSLDQLGMPGFEAPPPFHDPARIHLLSRDIHSHPSRDGVLVLSATFTNLAEQAQAYPLVTVSLMNADDRILATRRFEPAEYLLRAPAGGALLPPGAQVPLLLEFADPGEQASGFEMTFH